MPKVSVVIPLYNKAAYVRRAVDSVLSQTERDFEVIVVDDGSTDGGSDIVQGYSDKRLKYLWQENQGVSAARNAGIAEGKCDYVAFLDADDEWNVDFLAKALALTKLYPQAGIYGTGYCMVFPEGPRVEITVTEAKDQETLLVTDYFYRANGGNFINASGVVIPRRVFSELGAFKVGEHEGEDLEMWARIALRYPIGYDTRVLFYFFQTGDDDKPRFKKPYKNSPKVLMLQKALGEIQSWTASREMLMSHIKDHVVQMCLWLAINNDRASVLEFLKNCNAMGWVPFLCWGLRIPFLWPIVKLVAWVNRNVKSRFMLRILGGMRVSNGVVFRLNPSNGC